MMNLPNKAVVFTAYNRIGYLSKVLNSWKNVRGKEEWFFYFSIDKNPLAEDVASLCYQFIRDEGLSFAQVVITERKHGVLHHPWVAFETMFSAPEIDFVVRVEDDLIVSDDFLEYMDWGRVNLKDREDVLSVIGYVDEYQGEPYDVKMLPRFSPWNWGIWRDRWELKLRDTWDHDYSTYNGRPGYQAGWDWNIDTRLLPKWEMLCAYPGQSRVQNIGINGTHAVNNHDSSRSFHEYYGPQEYTLDR